MVFLWIFSVVLPTEPCALRSTQPLKVSTRDFSWGKGGRCVWLTTYHPCSVETSTKTGALIYPEPLGPPRPVAGDLCFTSNYININNKQSVFIHESPHQNTPSATRNSRRQLRECNTGQQNLTFFWHTRKNI